MSKEARAAAREQTTSEKLMRQSTLAAVMLAGGGSNRLDVLQRVGAYGESFATGARRMADDMDVLGALGLSIDRGSEEASYAASFKRVEPSGELADTIYAAAQEVGRGFVYERLLRVAVRKLTGRSIGQLQGAPQAVVTSLRGCRAVAGAEQSLATGYVMRAELDGPEQVFEPHALVMGGGRVQIAGRLDSRWVCALAEDVKARVSKIVREQYKVRAVPKRLLQVPQALGRRVGAPTFEQLVPNALSYAWTVASLAARGEATTANGVIRAIGGTAEEVQAAVDIANCTHVDGQYVGYIAQDNGRLTFEDDAFSHVIEAGWPLTPGEARAVSAALALAHADEALAEFEQLTGLRGHVVTVQGAETATGQLQLLAA
jgi:hypothetical protein